MPSILNLLPEPIIDFLAFLERTFINLTRPSHHSLALSIACRGQDPRPSELQPRVARSNSLRHSRPQPNPAAHPLIKH